MFFLGQNVQFYVFLKDLVKLLYSDQKINFLGEFRKISLCCDDKKLYILPRGVRGDFEPLGGGHRKLVYRSSKNITSLFFDP